MKAYDTEHIIISTLTGLLLGLLVGMLVTSSVKNSIWEKSAISRDYGYYNKDLEFKWGDKCTVKK